MVIGRPEVEPPRADKTDRANVNAWDCAHLPLFRLALCSCHRAGKALTLVEVEGANRNRLGKDKRSGIDIKKEDIFYYIYGILHSPEYRARFEANLKKELPRIPLADDFVAFAEAGRGLAKLHLDYESVDKYPLEVVGSEENAGPVVKLKWGKKTDPVTKKKVDDHTVLVYNKNLTFKGIPATVDRYVVNGRTPLEWMIDRYQVKTDKASGIVNDPNEYSDDPMYVIDLIKRLVTVSVDTMSIVDSLPPLHEKPQTANWPFAWKANS